MREAEQRALPYLFKLRLTANVKRAIERLSRQSEWVDAGQGWQAKESAVRLEGWSRQRRIIVLAAAREGRAGGVRDGRARASRSSSSSRSARARSLRISVLVTSLVEDLESFGQLYRDRGDGENIFDEMKNQWGWGGFVTHDLARCRLAARLVALFYNWWNIFVRLAEPDRHREAITSRPLLLHAIAERVRHARQTTISIASTHAKSRSRRQGASRRRRVPARLGQKCGAVDALQRWRAILSRAFQAFLKGRPLRAPPRLCPS